MTDETKTEAPARKGGWPKGKKRPAKAAPAAAAHVPLAVPAAKPDISTKLTGRPNWEDMSEVADGVDQYKVDPQKIRDLEAMGYALQWIPDSVRGQPDPRYRAMFEKGGWHPLHQADLDGLFNGDFMQKNAAGEINVGGQVLAIRPVEIHRKSKAAEKRAADEPLEIKRAELRGGIPGVSGSDHPTALRGNTINRERAGMFVPND